MVKFNNSSTSSHLACLLDSDVIINWLSKEKDPASNKELWEAPQGIIKLIEEGKVVGFSTLVNLLEIRFVLRRKKGLSESAVEEDIAKLLGLLEFMIPGEVNLLEANELQLKYPLSPLDAILIAVGLSMTKTSLISRDKNLLTIASKVMPTATPEDFLKELES